MTALFITLAVGFSLMGIVNAIDAHQHAVKMAEMRARHAERMAAFNRIPGR